jgi:hypothetical protein
MTIFTKCSVCVDNRKRNINGKKVRLYSTEYRSSWEIYQMRDCYYSRVSRFLNRGLSPYYEVTVMSYSYRISMIYSWSILYLLLMTARVEFSFGQSALDRHSRTIWRQTSLRLTKSLLTRHFFSSPRSRRIASSSPLSFARAIDSGIIT